MVYDGTQFGLWLRRHRKARDMTQRELAAQIGCSEFTLRKFEAGTRRPSRQIVERMAKILGISGDEVQTVMGWARLGTNSQVIAAVSQPPVTDLRISVPNNLPSRLTRLIGRERELARSREYLLRDDLRLLTLTGPPGVGKTRLAVQIATNLLDSFSDGVFFVELALARDAAMLTSIIAQALGYKQPGVQDALSDLAQLLGNKQMLLLLDNFEQIVSLSPEVVRLLELCPQLKALVTSREPLEVRGEQQFEVPTLPLPDPPISPSPERLLEYDSVALFVERATAVNPDFELTAENSADVAAICASLDGLPLAIELAAAHVRTLSTAKMLTQLDHSLALLTGGARDLPARHQTLRAAIDWSYDLLSSQEQLLFSRFSVFAGGCSLQALDAVAGRQSAFGLAKPLVHKSLLQQREGVGNEPRLYMLQTIRERATERLEERQETEKVRARHAQYFTAFAEEAQPELSGPEQETWFDRVEQDLDNIRAALDWALGRSEYELAARISGALRRFWDVRGYWTEGRRWLEPALAHSEALSTSVRANAALGAGRLAYFQDDLVRSQLLLEESLQSYRDARDNHGAAEALSGLAYLATRQGQREVASNLLEESLAVSRELGDRQSIARTLGNLGRIAMEGGNYERAAVLEREALSVFRELHDNWGTAIALENLGQLAAEQADYELAVSLLEESLTLNQELGDKGHIAWVLGDLGIATLAAGDYERSMDTYGEASRLFVELGDKSGLAMALFMRGVALAYQGDNETAVSSFRESLQMCVEMGDEAGCALGTDGLAFVASATGDFERAAELAGMAEMLRGEAGYRVQIIEHPLHERTLATIRAATSEGDLQRSLAVGRSMEPQRAIAYALAYRLS